MRNKIFNAREIALIGVMAATLECGKLILSAIANVEVVTILCALYGYVFGWIGVAAAAAFVFIEPLIYGFGSWLIYYIIYWPLVAFVFMVLGKKKIQGRLINTAVAIGLTIFFGILSTVVDSAVLLGINEHFFANMALMYARGIPFFLVHIGCNGTIFVTLFPYLTRKMTEIRALCGFDKM